MAESFDPTVLEDMTERVLARFDEVSPEDVAVFLARTRGKKIREIAEQIADREVQQPNELEDLERKIWRAIEKVEEKLIEEIDGAEAAIRTVEDELTKPDYS